MLPHILRKQADTYTGLISFTQNYQFLIIKMAAHTEYKCQNYAIDKQYNERFAGF